MTISEYLKHAELAQAGYANLASGAIDGFGRKALQDDANMTLTQAQTFASNWTVIDQYDGMVEQPYFDEFGQEQTFLNPTGLSVTLFKNNYSGEQVIAIRGTQDLSDWGTNLVDIGLLGSAKYQDQYKALSDQINSWKADDILQSGFTVSGHSLGGFLATNLALNFPTDVANTFLYNAPGVVGVIDGNILASIANALSPGTPISIPDVPSISNIVATWDPVSEIGLLVGTPITIQIESNADPIHNHSIATLTDALAVYNLFASIDPSATVDTITSIFNSSAYAADRTLESAVSAVGELLLPGFTTRTGNEYNTDRDLLYSDLHDISAALEGVNIELLVKTAADGTLTPFSPAEIENQAKGDIAHRYALVNLNPFAVLEEQVAA